MPVDEFAELKAMQNAMSDNLMSKLPSLNDFVDKTPSCPKCKASETFLNHNDEYECAVCSYNWH